MFRQLKISIWRMPGGAARDQSLPECCQLMPLSLFFAFGASQDIVFGLSKKSSQPYG